MALSIGDKGSKPSTPAPKSEPKGSTSAGAAPQNTSSNVSGSTKASTPTKSGTPSVQFKDSFVAGSTKQAPVALNGDTKSASGLGNAAGGKAGATAGSSGPTVTTDASGRTVVDLGSGDNKATVTQLPDGRVSVTADGTTVTLTAEQSRRVTIQGGDGADEIQVNGNVTADIRLEGGAGNDTLRGGDGKETLIGGDGNDVITGGKGNDYISGGDGEDYLEGGEGDDVISGGKGRDTMYGLDGADVMLGGADQDYMDGGKGDDRVSGDDGNDVLFGGQGNDSIGGGNGDDVIAGGAGVDRSAGGAGADTTYHQDDDVVIGAEAADTAEVVDLSTTVGTSVEVEGSPEFQARVESDLDALRSIPSGREMLSALDASGHKTTIVQQAPEDGNKARPTNRANAELRDDGTPGPGTDATILYHPERSVLGGGAEDWMVRPPMIGLFHEMVHAYNYVTGTLPKGETHQDAHGVHGAADVNNSERAAVGLPYDHDGDPRTPMITADQPNENQLREELGLPPRPHY